MSQTMPWRALPRRRSTARATGTLAATLVAVLGPATVARAAVLPATPATLSSVFAAAQSGDVITLAAGSYGTFSGGSKSGTVTIRPQSGASASMQLSLSNTNNVRLEGLTITRAYLNGARNTTIANSRFTGPTRVDTPITGANVVFDGDTFDGITVGSGDYEGRLSVRGYNNSAPVGVQVRNSHFGGGGCSDGVQIVGDAYAVRIGPGNVFEGLSQSGCAAHVDSVQLYGSSHTQIVGNLLRNNSTAIMAPDGGDHEVITDNVFLSSDGYPEVQLGSHVGTTFSHNTVLGFDVHMDHKSGAAASTQGVVKDNVFVNASVNALASGNCSGCTVDHNLYSSSGDASGTSALIGTAQFSGGSNPSTWSGYTLAAGSPGKGNASDGLDRGIRASAAGGSGSPSPTPSPSPSPSPSPTPTDTPASASWTVPRNVRVGQYVTLDATASRGNAPLTCTWSFENQDGSTVWETITGCRISKRFQYTGTKYVELTVRDADGDTDVNRQSFVVTAG